MELVLSFKLGSWSIEKVNHLSKVVIDIIKHYIYIWFHSIKSFELGETVIFLAGEYLWVLEL